MLAILMLIIRAGNRGSIYARDSTFISATGNRQVCANGVHRHNTGNLIPCSSNVFLVHAASNSAISIIAHIVHNAASARSFDCTFIHAILNRESAVLCIDNNTSSSVIRSTRNVAEVLAPLECGVVCFDLHNNTGSLICAAYCSLIDAVDNGAAAVHSAKNTSNI